MYSPSYKKMLCCVVVMWKLRVEFFELWSSSCLWKVNKSRNFWLKRSYVKSSNIKPLDWCLMTAIPKDFIPPKAPNSAFDLQTYVKRCHYFTGGGYGWVVFIGRDCPDFLVVTDFSTTSFNASWSDPDKCLDAIFFLCYIACSPLLS